jgi:hypothetical protein
MSVIIERYDRNVVVQCKSREREREGETSEENMHSSSKAKDSVVV